MLFYILSFRWFEWHFNKARQCLITQSVNVRGPAVARWLIHFCGFWAKIIATKSFSANVVFVLSAELLVDNTFYIIRRFRILKGWPNHGIIGKNTSSVVSECTSFLCNPLLFSCAMIWTRINHFFKHFTSSLYDYVFN